MSYLEYNFTNTETGLCIDDYLEKHNKKNNDWWKSLSGVGGVFNTHLEWFRDSAKKYFDGNHHNAYKGTPLTAKTCPAIGKGFLDKIFLIKLPCDMFIEISNDGQYYYQLPDTSIMSMNTHPTHQFHSKENNIFENYVNIKFQFPIHISAGNNPLLYLDPQYHNFESEFKILNGVIDPKYQPQELNVNTLVKIEKQNKHFMLKKGTVLGYLWTPKQLTIRENKKLKLKTTTRFANNYR